MNFLEQIDKNGEVEMMKRLSCKRVEFTNKEDQAQNEAIKELENKLKDKMASEIQCKINSLKKTHKPQQSDMAASDFNQFSPKSEIIQP